MSSPLQIAFATMMDTSAIMRRQICPKQHFKLPVEVRFRTWTVFRRRFGLCNPVSALAALQRRIIRSTSVWLNGVLSSSEELLK
jgi:hypothetical protein